jgi:tRNA(Ile)-lysidine synthase
MAHASTRPATKRVANALRAALRRHRQALTGGPLLLAVSGGPDSMAMLLAASTLGDALRRRFVVAHFSHGLRPSAERKEAALVKRVAAAIQLPVHHEKARVEPGEAAARDARYAFLSRTALHTGASAVLTAHTQDDQAETVLLRIIRGSGTRGAGGIRELSSRRIEGSKITLLRPMLAVGRTDTRSVCQEAGISAATDGSNRSVRFARNRIRIRVLPELARLNPEVGAALARFAANAQADDDLLASIAAGLVDGEGRRPDRVTWPKQALFDLAAPLEARVLQSAWASLAGEGASLSAAKLATAGRLIRNPEGGELALGRGARLVVDQQKCTMEWLTPPPQRPGPVPLQLPGQTVLGLWSLHAVVIGASDVGVLDSDPYCATLDLDRLAGALSVRTRKPGDRFQPLGMEAPTTLQDVLVNARVARGERDGLPLLTCDAGIAWVVGVRIAHWARVTEATKRALRLKAEES